MLNIFGTKLINIQEPLLEKTNEHLEKTEKTIESTTKTLEKAKQYQQTTSILKITGLATLIGIIIGGPLGAFGGSYIGLAFGGGLLGTVTGGGIAGTTAYSITQKKIKKFKNLKNKIS